MALQVQQNPSVHQRAKQKADVSHKVHEKEKRKEANTTAEVPEELVQGGAKENGDNRVGAARDVIVPGTESEGTNSVQTESEEDTVDEAPSIVDEAMSKEGTSQSSVVATVSVEVEVAASKDSGLLTKVDEEPNNGAKQIEEEPAKITAKARWGNKIKPIKALGLIGVMFRMNFKNTLK